MLDLQEMYQKFQRYNITKVPAVLFKKFLEKVLNFEPSIRTITSKARCSLNRQIAKTDVTLDRQSIRDQLPLTDPQIKQIDRQQLTPESNEPVSKASSSLDQPLLPDEQSMPALQFEERVAKHSSDKGKDT